MQNPQKAVESGFSTASDAATYQELQGKNVTYSPETFHPGSAPDTGSNPWQLAWSSQAVYALLTNEKVVGATATAIGNFSNATGAKHLTGSVTIPTGRIAVKFRIQLPELPMDKVAAGFVIFQYGADSTSGTVEVKYYPRLGDKKYPHELVVRVYGTDVDRICTLHPTHSNVMLPFYMEYDGTEIVVMCDRSSDHYFSTTSIPIASTAAIKFGADYFVNKDDAGPLATEDQRFYFDNLEIYSHTLVLQNSEAATPFPYFNWNGSNSGVIAVLPTPTIPEDYFIFIDRGYSAAHDPAVFNLDTTTTITSPKLYINEKEYTLSTGAVTGTTFVSYLVGLGNYAITIDGQQEYLNFVSLGGGSVKVYHKDYVSSELGKNSLAIRFTGGTGNDWNSTKPALGKIPPAHLHPYTGETNEGISILGANKIVTTPKGIKVTYKDDNVRTSGKIIASISNRPASNPAITRIEPINFFGSSRAPFPKGALILGNPKSLSSTKPDDQPFAFGVMHERYLGDLNAAKNHTMTQAPYGRFRQGDVVAGWSFDIPMGLTLRGVTINFSGFVPGYIGNKTSKRWEWGAGHQIFPMIAAGSTDYTIIYYLQIATDPLATKWRTIPSIGVDAIKVQGPNAWKEVTFKKIDLDALLDDDGYHLLRGQRRTHFRIVLAAEPTAVTLTGISRTIDDSAKK